MQLPTNVQIDTSEQGTPEWKSARLGKFTASRAGDLMKKQRNGSPYASRKDYIIEVSLERLTNEYEDKATSSFMQEGVERERTASLAYEFATGNSTEQVGFIYTDFYGASPDDLIIGQQGGVEYKNPKAATHYTTLKTGEIPEHYYWQILQNILVTGADFWDYVSFHPSFPTATQLFIKRIERASVLDDLELLKTELSKAHTEVEQEIAFITNYQSS